MQYETKLFMFRFCKYCDFIKPRQREEKMVTIRESAEKYEQIKTKNISELKEVNTEMDIKTKEFTNKAGEIVKYEYIIVDGEEYRVPVSVKQQLKEMLEENEAMTKFKVRKSGEGMKTKYTVIGLD